MKNWGETKEKNDKEKKFLISFQIHVHSFKADIMVFPGLTQACDFNLNLSKIVYNPSPLKYQVVIVPYSAMNLQISEKKRKREKGKSRRAY